MKNFWLSLALLVPSVAFADSFADYDLSKQRTDTGDDFWMRFDSHDEQRSEFREWVGDADHQEREADLDSRAEEAKTIITPEPDSWILLISATLVSTPFAIRRRRAARSWLP